MGIAGGVLVLALVAGTPTASYAWFNTTPLASCHSLKVVVSPSGNPLPGQERSSQVLPGLRQIGAASRMKGGDYTQPVRGFGHHVPIRNMVAELLGSGWTVRYKGVAPGTRIDWRGEQTLPQTLDKVARVYGLSLRIDWSGRTLVLERPGYTGKTLRESPPQTARSTGTKTSAFSDGPAVISGRRTVR